MFEFLNPTPNYRDEAERHLRARNFTEALRQLSAMVENADRRGASAHERVAARLELADTQRRTLGEHPQQLAAAEATVRGALALAAQVGDEHDYVDGLDALADIYVTQQNFIALEQVEQEAVRRGASLTRPDPLRMAKRVYRLGVARHMIGAHEEAAIALEKAVRLHEQCQKPDAPEFAALLSEAGAMLRAQGDLERARPLLERSWQLHINRHGADSEEALTDLRHLAACTSEPDRARERYQHCIKHAERHCTSMEIAELQFGLARAMFQLGEPQLARELLAGCMRIHLKDGGEAVAAAHDLLAEIELSAGRIHAANHEREAAAKARGR